MDFFICREPDFVVDVGLFEDDAGALLEIGEEAAGKFHVVDEEGVEADDIEGFFVYPDNAAEFLDDFFDQGAGFEFGVGLEVEDQDVLAAEAFAAGIDELAGAEESVYGDIFVFFFLLFLLVLLAGGCFLVGTFFEIVNFLQDAGVFLFLGFGAEGLAVDFHESGDFGAVEVEEGGFADVGLFGLAVAFVFGFFFDLGAGVIFFDFVEGLLVGINLFEEGFQIRELHLRFSGEIEDAFADGFVYCGAGDINRVTCGAAMQFDFVRELDAVFWAVIVVEDFLVHAAYFARILSRSSAIGRRRILAISHLKAW